MKTVWNYPTRVVFGIGACASLGEELRHLGLRRVLLVTDAGVRTAVVNSTVAPAARVDGCEVEIFDDLQGNPTEQNVDDGVAAYRAAGADGVLAVGGGSALDVGKLVSACVGSGRRVRELDAESGGDSLIPSKLPPVVAIPTTAGTGSEVGRAAVFTLSDQRRKAVVFAASMMPVCALLDPELTRGLPSRITAATGFDALTHCLEALCASGEHPMADGIALEGIRLASLAIRAATRHGDTDLASRGAMMKAALMGAVAFQKGLGACHSMAHPLSSICGLHHGVANAVCLPAVVRYNGTVVPQTFERALRAIGAEPSSNPAETLARWLEGLRSDLELPSSLLPLGVTADHVNELSTQAFADGCHSDNPRSCSREDFRSLFRSCL